MTRTGGQWSRRTTLLLAAFAVLTAVLAPLAIQHGVDLQAGLYRVADDPTNPLSLAVHHDARFQVVDVPDGSAALRAGTVDLALQDHGVAVADTQKGHAALAALQEAARSETAVLMRAQTDQAAAFPLRVSVVYVTPGVAPAPGSGPGTGGGGGGTGGNGTGGGGNGTAGNATGGTTQPPAPGSLPGDIQPPLPFRPLLLAYVFLIPMNFVALAYGTSLMSERLNRRGEPLLATPAAEWEIVVGKSLPYLLLILVIALVTAPLEGAGALSVLAVVPLGLGLLSLTFLAALLARSFRELTFLTVFASVLVTTYAFLPAVFSDIDPIAFISPITLVVRDIQGRAVTPGQVAFATLPLTLASLVVYRLGVALFREEDLFSQKIVPRKLLDAVGRLVGSPLACAKVAVLFIPLVLAAELLALAFLFAWPLGARLPLAIAVAAVVEEGFKAAGPVAGLARGTIPRRTRALLLAGAASGVGFFLAEKGVLLASLAGVASIDPGAAVLGPNPPATVGLGLLVLLPLALHVTTAGLSAASARRGRATFALGFLGAVVLHIVYDLTVVAALG